MIDIEHEKLIAIHDVPKVLPPDHNRKRIHKSAVYRWMQRGRGGVRLEWIKIGGTRYTSLEALQRFADACTRSETSTASEPSQIQSPQQARRRVERAAARAQDVLGNTPKTRKAE